MSFSLSPKMLVSGLSENRNQGDLSNFGLHSFVSSQHAMNYSKSCVLFNYLYEFDFFSSVYGRVSVSVTGVTLLCLLSMNLGLITSWVCSCYFSLICIVHIPDFHLVSFRWLSWSCWFSCWSHMCPRNKCLVPDFASTKLICISN
jgi:hypothetical protein